MDKWEYLVQDGYELPLEDYLNKMGKEGWELTSVICNTSFKTTRLIFKRKILNDLT